VVVNVEVRIHETGAGTTRTADQDFVNVVAVGIPAFECIGAVVLAQDLPVVVIVIMPGW
jgi:hypothetical protein